jgi:hypothetical protein
MAINDNYPRSHRLEAVALNESIHTTVRWGAIFAGALIALLVYATLISLGMAFGGDSLQNVVTGEASAKSLGIGAGIWLVASVLLSLLAGGFVSGRVAGQHPGNGSVGAFLRPDVLPGRLDDWFDR